jgi:hypothetical protein
VTEELTNDCENKSGSKTMVEKKKRLEVIRSDRQKSNERTNVSKVKMTDDLTIRVNAEKDSWKRRKNKSRRTVR